MCLRFIGEMNLDPGIVCYQHCEGRLFAFCLPPSCTICGKDLTKEPLSIPPFRVPYPFVRASQTPCCLVIKPSRGDFLHDYRSSNDLHIGVTNSDGCVYEYDSDGLHSDLTASWNQCLSVPLITDSSNHLDPVWKEYWDFTLHSLAQDPSWVMERYCQHSFNCYSFILKFLQTLAPPGLDVKTLSKTSLCAELLLPHTSNAAKYISLYRRLLSTKVLSVPKSS
ncbi:hypothetical protein Pmani_021703 [Petrolisthes manimaculis]|uniref:MKRN2 opposite strand protein-like C-terminal domain-containing protein n=1 Tax=Petrolisthes manimaculis TaxID=1843537 RepID=A0AAE1PFI3_9EUCA|nr:hypothetical protein Pmani_021703 [Petrolisthes manimaculis]